jgi:RNA polymerase sigma factor (sigma-70 family)
VPGPFDRLRDEELVADFLRLRESDPARADALWWELVGRAFDRVRTTVATFRWSPQGHDLRIDASERDDVVAKALIRLHGAGRNFTGPNLAVFRVYTVSTVKHTCMDHLRQTMNREKHERGSMDERLEESDERGPLDAVLGRIAEIEADEGHERLEADWVVYEALGRVDNDGYREVLQMTLDGMPDSEIAAQLALEINNVQARRSRGLKALREKLREVLGDDIV